VRMRWNEMTANQRFNDSARLDLWEPAIRMWRENVWFGVGPNHYNYRFRAYRPQDIQLQPDRVHNDYLNALTDWGVVGFVLVAGAWVLLYAGVAKTWRYVRGSPADFGGGNSNKFAVVLGASCGLAAILVHSVIDFNMQIPANAILAITLMAMLAGSLRFATERYWIGARLPSKLLVSALLAAGLAGLGWQLARGAAEYRWLRKAQALPDASLEQIAALKKAFEAEPQNFLTAYYIGRALRIQSEVDEQLAREAIQWFERSAALNPHHAYSYLEHGICLDFPIGDVEAAMPFFEKAVELDPNGYFTSAWMGWHYVQAGDDAAARVWFERSKRLQPTDNMIADKYLPIVTERMLRKATNSSSLLLQLNR
ncbi:MAG TPA: O-antigen ligase family protein, partial [Verrucomicrobiota bacterium]|nr:O-antigen ligase family protein [Verrucomicrobiota bacterium]